VAAKVSGTCLVGRLRGVMEGRDVAAARSLARAVAEELQRRSLWIGVAESLTGGMLSSFLAAAPNASEWFRGGIVAYSRAVKRDVLHVRPGPVVSEGAALDMARVRAACRASLCLVMRRLQMPTSVEKRAEPRGESFLNRDSV
jgi:nicotinamide mononucleotide (NMN) deamidase PncC